MTADTPRPAAHLLQIEDTLLSDISAVLILGALFKRMRPSDWSAPLNLGGRLPPAALAILTRAGVIAPGGALTDAFVALWQARGPALVSRIDFILKAARDLIDHGEALLRDPEEFMQRSQVFAMFDYSQGFETGPVARARTEHWCRYVAALSDVEGQPLSDVIAKMISATRPRRVLEVGGNIGAFARHLQARLAVADYMILDIPQVCAIGSDDARLSDLKIRFRPGDMHRMDWTETGKDRPDCIVFKSVLHDWPSDRVRDVLARAVAELAPEGQIVIAERCAFQATNLSPPSAADIANMVFAPFYREAEVYHDLFQALDPAMGVTTSHLTLDMRWFVLVAGR